jgi:hypothetical protein
MIFPCTIRTFVIPSRVLFPVVAVLLVAASGAQAEDLSGAWRGRWESCTTGHQGPLSGDFCKLDETHYRVRFRGRFWVVFPFRYTVTLTVVGRTEERVLLTGAHDLGPLLGTFHFTAEATATQFVAHYCARRDRGQFVLCRCCP